MLRILHIEDIVGWSRGLETVLKERLDIECQITPITTFAELSSKFPSSEEFNEVDICFVDIEITTEPVDYDKTIIDGITKVIPYIRKNAPGMPAICISRFLNQSSKAVVDASLCEFDALIPKAFLLDNSDQANPKTGPEFNVSAWRRITETCYTKRAAWALGETLEVLSARLDSDAEMVPSPGIADLIPDEDLAILNEAKNLFGLHTGRVMVDYIEEGYSGNYTSVLSLEVKDTGANSSWFFKWGRNISNLECEIFAHRNLYYHGVDRDLVAFPLVMHALRWKSYGFLVYRFEEEVAALNQMICLAFKNDKNRKVSLINLGKLCRNGMRDLYKNQTIRAESCVEVIILIFSNEFWEKHGDRLKIMVSSKNIKLRSSYIHGDLNLRNILCSEDRVTFIDFAHALTAPIAIDYAKLCMDYIATFYDRLSAIEFPLRIQNLTGRDEFMDCLLSEFADLEDEVKIFELAINAYSIQYTFYDGVNKKLKESIKSAFKLK